MRHGCITRPWWTMTLATGALALAHCGEAPPTVAGTAYDLSGRAVDPTAAGSNPATVVVFVRDDCRISNRYAPTLRQLHAEFVPRGVAFFLAYPDPDVDADAIRAHLADYRHPGTPLRDPDHALVRRAGATITPEAVVFASDGRLTYRGRIDDWYVAFGRTRPAATTYDLRDALEATLAGRPVEPSTTKAVGCFIVDLEPAKD
jgi:hypothetical protein